MCLSVSVTRMTFLRVLTRICVCTWLARAVHIYAIHGKTRKLLASQGHVGFVGHDAYPSTATRGPTLECRSAGAGHGLLRGLCEDFLERLDVLESCFWDQALLARA
jgi:hypothetical protein